MYCFIEGPTRYEDNFLFYCVVNPMITFSAPEGGVYIVNETFPVEFMCSATGIPVPEIQWRRGSLILEPGNNTMFTQRLELSAPTVDQPERSVASVTRTLIIRDTVAADADDYSCVANNSALVGRDEQIFELFVQGIYIYMAHTVSVILK